MPFTVSHQANDARSSAASVLATMETVLGDECVSVKNFIIIGAANMVCTTKQCDIILFSEMEKKFRLGEL